MIDDRSQSTPSGFAARVTAARPPVTPDVLSEGRAVGRIAAAAPHKTADHQGAVVAPRLPSHWIRTTATVRAIIPVVRRQWHHNEPPRPAAEATGRGLPPVNAV
jgi:hypothetical protein